MADSTPADDDSARARPEALRAIADANADATFGNGPDGDGDAAVAPGLSGIPGAGLLTGEIGPKGRVSAQLRGLSRAERATYGEVPRGTALPGGGRYLLLMLLAVVVACCAIVALLGWLIR